MSASIAGRSWSRAGRSLPGSTRCARSVPSVLCIATASCLGQDVGDRQLASVTPERELAGLDSHDESGDADRHVKPGPFELPLESIAQPGPRGIGMPDTQALQRGIEDLV